MIATKTSEESQIKFGLVKKRVGGGVFSFYPPSQKNDATALLKFLSSSFLVWLPGEWTLNDYIHNPSIYSLFHTM